MDQRYAAWAIVVRASRKLAMLDVLPCAADADIATELTDKLEAAWAEIDAHDD